MAMCLESCPGIPFGGSRHHRQSSGIAAIVPPMIYIMDAVMQLNLAAWSDSGSLMPMAFPPSCSMVVQRHISISEHMKDHASRDCSILGHRARFSLRTYPGVWWCFGMLSHFLVGRGFGVSSWSELEMRRLVQWHMVGFGSVAWLVGAPPSRGMFIAMKYGGLEAISERVALSFSGLPFAVR